MNISSDPINVLKKNLQELLEAVKWLQRSYGICQQITLKQKYTPEEYDAFEVLTSRFSRVCDFVVNKILRSIDRVELEDAGGTLIDVINRAHKRGIIESVESIRQLKELRNVIAHEYATDELKNIFKSVFSYAPGLIQLAGNVNEYCQKKFNLQ